MTVGQRLLFTLLVSFALALSVFSPARAADVVKIMPLGDSITRGYYGSDYDWGYRQPLYVALTNDGYDFDFVGSRADGNFPGPQHEGYDGWHADEILDGRTSNPSAGKLEEWLDDHQPDVVLLHIGTNDITSGDQDANEVSDILDVIDDYEDNASKQVMVVLALIINRQTYSPATTQFNNDVNAMAMNRIAGGDNIIIVDMESALDYVTDMYDNLHPNDDGYVKMAGVWYPVLVDYLEKKTLAIYAEAGGSVNDPGEGVFRYDDGTDVNIAAVPELNYHFVNWTGTAVTAGKVADANAASTTVLVDDDYTLIANFTTDKLDEINQRLELRTSGIIADFASSYSANGWKFDVSRDFAVKVDFHYGDGNVIEGRVGISVGDDVNYVSISAGVDGNDLFFFYEAVVDGNAVFEQEPRDTNDGTLYIWFNAALKEFYLSHTGFSSEDAYNWETPGAAQGQWALPVDVSVGGGSSSGALESGEAYLDSFGMVKAGLLGWPPITDIDSNGFIEIDDLAVICENWLGSGTGDIDSDGTVGFIDYGEFGLAW